MKFRIDENEVTIKCSILPHGQGMPLPSYATPGSAGLDLAAAVTDDIIIEPLERALVPTGIQIAVPAGFEAQVRSRSGLAFKNAIILPNSPGTIDSDYRGEVKVILMNLGDSAFRITRGMRIAQMVIAPVAAASLQVVEELPRTDRGGGGFGHTGS